MKVLNTFLDSLKCSSHYSDKQIKQNDHKEKTAKYENKPQEVVLKYSFFFNLVEIIELEISKRQSVGVDECFDHIVSHKVMSFLIFRYWLLHNKETSSECNNTNQ